MAMPRKKPGFESKIPPREELERMYAEHTAKELAAHYGMSESTIRRWINKYRSEEQGA